MIKFVTKTVGALVALPLLYAAAPAAAMPTTMTVSAPASQAPITLAEVQAAQTAWGNALVAISTEYEREGREAAARLAGRVLDSAYGYNLGPVLFKPTLTVAPQTFRATRDGALAYFVGGDKNFPNDTGFALKGWRSVEVETRNVVLAGNSAMSVGNVSMTDKDGKVTTVDKTWGYVRGADGNLRIVLHHSSLPYSAK